MRKIKCGLTVAAVFFAVSLQAQELTQKVSFAFPAGSPLVKTLEEFAARTGLGFTYSKEDFKGLKIKNVKCESIPVNDCLQEVITGLPIAFRMRGNLISLKYNGSNAVVSGNGHLSGKIVNEVGEPVTRAVVSVAGKIVVTDNNGDFSLDLPSGEYTLTVKAEKYSSLRVEKLTVKGNETNTVSFVMRSASENETSIKEVVITGIRKADTQAGLLAQQKKAAQMSDGISAEQISKTPDSDVGATLKRVTGVTTVDNKYVVVRSMGERWNTAAMDGINLPSTEAYNNNFSFDIIPTAMVESVVVSKTATPDMNASFAGGYVEVHTKDIPNKDFLTLSMGSSYNDISTFKEFLTRQRGKNDYWGYDDGTRNFPKGLEPMDWNNPQFFEQSKQFKDNFSTFKTTADLNSNYQLAFGKSFKMKNNNKWGFAGAVTVRNEQNKLDIDHTGRGNWLDTAGPIGKEQQQGLAPVKFYNFKNKGASYSYNSTVAGMLNFGLQLGKSRISFRNSYTHIYDNTLTRVTGWNEYTGGSGMPENAEASYNYFYNGVIPNNDPSQLQSMDRPYTDNTVYPVYQTLLQNKLEGSHKIGNAELSWFAARTGVESDTKDYTQHQTYYQFIGNEILTYNQIYNSGNNFSRGYIESKETDYNFGTSFKWSMDVGNFKNDIKVGYAGALKNNTNAQEKFFLKVDENRANVPINERNYLMMYGALTDWFDGSHYTTGGIGWQTKPLYKNSKYEGEVTQHAPYLMLDNRLGNKLRLVWGVRAEYFKYEQISQQLDPDDSRNLNKEPIEDRVWQWMPSANFTYSPTNKMNLRLAYGRSVLRPQFNERTGLPYFDPVANALIYNTELTSSVIDNYDFKFEWFPGLGEIISAGLYYKDIARPIEREGYISNEGNLYLYNGNSANAKLKGFEVEVRKNLGFIAENTLLNNLFVSGNFTYNDTKVVAFKNRFNTENNAETYEVERPLYGQTPWAYNLGLSYDGERLGLNFLYNAKGEQYITVGYDYNGEEIQRPYAVADAQVSYKLLKDKNLEIKFNAKNIFNRVIEYYNNYNSYSVQTADGNTIAATREGLGLMPGATDKYDKDIDKILFRAYRGRTLGLSINYTF
ncbi:TonB-dependent receptor [Chryseobacterium sp. 3008163]|uniref:TonB-dependent receptor n=1 Tax=Chryseobacterium sp. 3008163 TaxID=2478663 RepID=UPI000F0CB87F|nr:TonB-dependent receptor [Chryseobacterium sp. 3008163]AYN01848.1 TonB-dependent receptor [Chryseobacterium sp. 3008163]